MHTWHYQIRKTTNTEGDDWFDVVEMYGTPLGHTCSGIRPGGATKAEVIKDLTRMLADAKRYRVLVEK